MLEEEWKVKWYLNIQVIAAGPTEVRLALVLLKYTHKQSGKEVRVAATKLVPGTKK